MPGISKSFAISADYKDQKIGPSWESPLFAEVVLIDKTNPHSFPVAYQLLEDLSFLDGQKNSKSFLLPLSRDSFFQIGCLSSFDKKTKQIILVDERIVIYYYLIIASGVKPRFSFSVEELSAGFYALQEALKVTQNLTFPSSMQVKSLSYVAKEESVSASAIPLQKIEDSQQTLSFSFPFHQRKQRVYEVHL